MHRIDTTNKAVDLFGAGKHGWRDGNKALGINATEFNAAMMNMLQEELAALPEGVGMTLDPNNRTQVREAIKRMIDAQAGNYALDTGAANAYVVALDPAITAYTDGMTVRVKAVNANNGASTLNAGGGAVALVNDAGGALADGDIAAGSIFTATYIASANKFYITSLVLGQVMSQAQGDARYAALGGLNTQTFSVAEAASHDNATRASQIQKQSLTSGTTGGTSTAYTLGLAAPLQANAEWVEVDVEFHTAAGLNPTLAVDGLAELSIKYLNSAGALLTPTSTEIPSGWRSKLVCDGTYWVLREIAGSNVSALTIQVFTSSGIWTKPAGCRKVRVRVVGGGGGGGGANSNGGAGGGGGGYAEDLLSAAALTTETVTIGAAGTGGAGGGANNGTAGGTTSFGTHVVATGGFGGGGGNGAAGSGGVGTTGMVATGGSSGVYSTTAMGGGGGSSALGGGGAATGAAGSAGRVYGGGGGGGTGTSAGGNGASGLVIVEEFY